MQVHVRAIAVGPLASVWIVSDDGCLWLRLGVSWQTPLGTAWWPVPAPSYDPEMPQERIVQLAVGTHAVWVTANSGRVWFRKDVNLVEEKPELQMGTQWIEMVGRLRSLSLALHDQLWAIERDTHQLVWRTGVDATSLSGKTWKPLLLPIDHTLLSQAARVRFFVSASATEDSQMLSFPMTKLNTATSIAASRSNPDLLVLNFTESCVEEFPVSSMPAAQQLSHSNEDLQDKPIDYITPQLGADIKVAAFVNPKDIKQNPDQDVAEREVESSTGEDDTDTAGLSQFFDPLYEEPVSDRLAYVNCVSAAALHLDKGELPSLWRDLCTRHIYHSIIVANCDWRTTLLEKLRSRNDHEHTAAAFRDMDDIVDHVSIFITVDVARLVHRCTGAQASAGVGNFSDTGGQIMDPRSPRGPVKTLINSQTSAGGTKRRYRLILFSIVQNSLQ